ncbi:MAG TPA: hypothetical protein VFC06_00450 [Demequina sp.]|nr:hypothetical protein [Demequina sp.]
MSVPISEECRSFGGRGRDPDWDRDRKSTPQHVLYQRHDYGDGVVYEHTSISNWSTPDDALASRIKRLKNTGTKYSTIGRTVTFEDANPERHTVTLTYADPNEARP